MDQNGPKLNYFGQNVGLKIWPLKGPNAILWKAKLGSGHNCTKAIKPRLLKMCSDVVLFSSGKLLPSNALFHMSKYSQIQKRLCIEVVFKVKSTLWLRKSRLCEVRLYCMSLSLVSIPSRKTKDTSTLFILLCQMYSIAIITRGFLCKIHQMYLSVSFFYQTTFNFDVGGLLHSGLKGT